LFFLSFSVFRKRLRGVGIRKPTGIKRIQKHTQAFAKKKYHYDFPCFVAYFISLFILVGLGSQLLGG